MKRFAFLAAVACLWGAALASPARAFFVTYDVYQGGTSGTLLAEFTTADFVVNGTDLNPFTLTKAISGLGTGPGELSGTLAGGIEAELLFFNFASGGGAMADVLTSSQFPTSPGTYALDTLASEIANHARNPIATPDTLVVTATPEPASLTLLSVGGVALLGYGWRRRKRTAV